MRQRPRRFDEQPADSCCAIGLSGIEDAPDVVFDLTGFIAVSDRQS